MVNLAAVQGGIFSERPRSLHRVARFPLTQHPLVEFKERRIVDRVFPLNP